MIRAVFMMVSHIIPCLVRWTASPPVRACDLIAAENGSEADCIGSMSMRAPAGRRTFHLLPRWLNHGPLVLRVPPLHRWLAHIREHVRHMCSLRRTASPVSSAMGIVFTATATVAKRLDRGCDAWSAWAVALLAVAWILDGLWSSWPRSRRDPGVDSGVRSHSGDARASSRGRPL